MVPLDCSIEAKSAVSCQANSRSARRRRKAKQRRFRHEETLILLDWDDTILPTTFLQAQGWQADSELSSTAVALLDTYACFAARVLQELRRLGRVAIVTNAEKGWVELTCRKFLPSLEPCMLGCELRSARSMYEPLGVSSPVQWKELCFAGLLSASVKNVFSVGDSLHERDALLLLQRKHSGLRCKSLKLLDRPDLQSLSLQHSLTIQILEQVAQLDAPLDLCVHTAGAGTDLYLGCGTGTLATMADPEAW